MRLLNSVGTVLLGLVAKYVTFTEHARTWMALLHIGNFKCSLSLNVERFDEFASTFDLSDPFVFGA